MENRVIQHGLFSRLGNHLEKSWLELGFRVVRGGTHLVMEARSFPRWLSRSSTGCVGGFVSSFITEIGNFKDFGGIPHLGA